MIRKAKNISVVSISQILKDMNKSDIEKLNNMRPIAEFLLSICYLESRINKIKLEPEFENIIEEMGNVIINT